MNRTKCFLCHDTNATIFGDEVDAAENYDLMCHKCGCDYTIQKGAAESLITYTKDKRDVVLDQVQHLTPTSGQFIFIKRVGNGIVVELAKNQEPEPEVFQ